MSTLCQPTPFPIGRIDTDNSTLAVRTVGTQYYGTFLDWMTSVEVPSSHDRLLHQMDRGRAISHNNREKHPKLCLERSDMSIWHPTSTRLR